MTHFPPIKPPSRSDNSSDRKNRKMVNVIWNEQHGELNMTKMTYGVPFRGSKNRIAKDIIEQLPSGNRLVDLFCGGCAITHAATLSDKWEKVLSNDPYPVMGQEVFR